MTAGDDCWGLVGTGAVNPRISAGSENITARYCKSSTEAADLFLRFKSKVVRHEGDVPSILSSGRLEEGRLGEATCSLRAARAWTAKLGGTG